MYSLKRILIIPTLISGSARMLAARPKLAPQRASADADVVGWHLRDRRNERPRRALTLRKIRPILEQPGNFTRFVDVDLERSGALAKARHGHNIARQRYDKARTCGNFDLTYHDTEITWCAQF